MTDYFALLGQPRRPWLEPTALKEAFLSRAKDAHPDKSKNANEEDYKTLNAAYQCLRIQPSRILHLLELESGNRPPLVQEVPDGLTDLFMRVTQTVRDVDVFLRVWGTVTGLVKAQHFPEAREWVEKLQPVQAEINSRTAALDNELRKLSDRWESEGSKPVGRLIELYQLFSYYARWSSQIQERITRLAS